MIPLLTASVLVMLVSVSGKLLVWGSARTVIEKHLDLLVSLAAGVFAVFAYGLLGEALEHTPALWGWVWVAVGIAGVTALCKLFPHGHKGHEHTDRHGHRHLDAHRLLVSDSLHNVGDGIFLAATFALNPLFGGMATASVIAHEVVQEIAEFFVLRDSGYSVNKALLLNFFTSSTVLVGAVGGYFLLDMFEVLEGPLLGVAAGGILTVVLFDLVPHALNDSRSRLGAHVLWFVLGAAAMLAVTSLLPHT